MLHYFLAGREHTQSYTVHEPPVAAGDRVTRAEALEFVRDGFSWQAFLLAPGWLIERKIWLGFIGYLLAVVGLVALGWLFSVPATVLWLVLLAIHLLIGSEADELMRAQLAHRGWSMVGQVTGTGRLDCERRFFDHWLASVPMQSVSVTATGPGAGMATGTAASQSTPVASTTASRTQRVLGSLLAPRHRTKS